MTIHELEPVALRAPGLVSVDGRVYPLESVRVAARAEGGIALTTLTQRFANPHAEALEVVYTLPLPADGAVLAYTIRMGEKVIRGEVQPRERAEAAYREALYQGRTAGLLEQDRADTFQQRLGNLPPHTAVAVEIEVLQPLAFLAGVDAGAPQWEYRFPTVVGVRYEGVAGRVPDAGRLDVDRAADGDGLARAEPEIVVARRVNGGPGINRERQGPCAVDVGQGYGPGHVGLAPGLDEVADNLEHVVRPLAPARVEHVHLAAGVVAVQMQEPVPAGEEVAARLRALKPWSEFGPCIVR